MPAPASPDVATSDDQMIAWAIKHGSVAENKAMARDMGVAYPSDVSVLGSTCDQGHGYVAVWAINFGVKDAHYNVTLDGVGYAGVIVRAKSHDYGAIGVPNQRHRLAFVDPATGRVASSVRTSLHCGRVATAPTHAPATLPKRVTSKPAAHTSRPVTPKPARPSTAASAPHTSRPLAPVAPARAAGVQGPRVQADLVAAPAPRGQQPGAFAVGVMLSAVLGALVLGRRMRRV